MTRRYKYWLYFIIPEYKEQVCLENEDNLLYAYTDKKKLAEGFEQSRNMDLFKKKKVYLTREDVNLLAKEYPNSILNYHPAKTRTAGVGSPVIMSGFVCTMCEKIHVNNIATQMMLSTLWQYTWVNPYIFESKYVKALNYTNYILGYNMLNKTPYKSIDYPMPDEIAVDIDDILKIMYPDLMSIFIHHFAYLLRR